MNKINSYIFKKRAKKYLAKNVREKKFVNYSKAKNILLLFESDFSEKNPQVRKIIYTLQNDGKKVSAWGFIDKKEVLTAVLPDFKILNHKETDFFEKPSTCYINELINHDFDLLIDLSLKPTISLLYIVLYSNALCKTGIRKTNLSIYDFMLNVENISTSLENSETDESEIDEMFLFNQIIFYLKNIQSND